MDPIEPPRAVPGEAINYLDIARWLRQEAVAAQKARKAEREAARAAGADFSPLPVPIDQDWRTWSVVDCARYMAYHEAVVRDLCGAEGSAASAWVSTAGTSSCHGATAVPTLLPPAAPRDELPPGGGKERCAREPSTAMHNPATAASSARDRTRPVGTEPRALWGPS